MKVETKQEIYFEFSENEVKQFLLHKGAAAYGDLEGTTLTSVGGGGQGRRLWVRFTKNSASTSLS